MLGAIQGWREDREDHPFGQDFNRLPGRSISMVGEEGIAATANLLLPLLPVYSLQRISRGRISPILDQSRSLVSFRTPPPPTVVRACTVKSTRGVEFQKRARRSAIVVASLLLLHSSTNFHEPCNVLEKSDTERRTGMHQLVNP